MLTFHHHPEKIRNKGPRGAVRTTQATETMTMKTITLNLPENTIETLLWALGHARAEASAQADTAHASPTPFDAQTINTQMLWDTRSFGVVRAIDILHNVLALSASQAKENQEDTQRYAAALAKNYKREAEDTRTDKRRLDRLAQELLSAEGAAYEAEIAWLRADAHYKKAIAAAQGEAK